MKTVIGKVQKIWGCITTCEDRLIIYQIWEEESKQMYYILSETSIELNASCIYLEKELPSILKEVLMLCQLYNSRLHHDTYKNKYILYGPHLTQRTEQIICEIPSEYIDTCIEYKEKAEDPKIKKFYKWLEVQIRQGE